MTSRRRQALNDWLNRTDQLLQEIAPCETPSAENEQPPTPRQ